ncbi:MAG: hypothetical protein J6C28_02070 [Bacilli bacterium]|nr:hypothetical protein [Bacilli bacterium]
MNELISFLTSQEIIVVYIVVAVACLLCFAIYLVDKTYYKRKQRHNTRELNKLVEEVSEIMEEEFEEPAPVEVFNTPVLETIDTVAYSAKVNEPVIISEENNIQNVVEEVKEEVIEPVAEAVEEEVIEQLEIEELEPINVEEIILDTMTEEVVENIEEQQEIKVETLEEVKEEVIEPVVEEELEYTTIEPNRQEAQEELMRLTQELEKAEQDQKNIDLTAYEEEQEENAIISLEELVQKSKAMYEANELTQYEDEGNEPISLADLEMRMNKVQEEVAAIESMEEITEEVNYDIPVITESFDINAVIPALEAIAPSEEVEEPKQMVLDDFNSIKLEPVVEEKKEPARPAYQSTKKFERSPVISPIYGIERTETKEDIELENTANYEKLDEEIKKTNEFLMTLRELQKNLD